MSFSLVLNPGVAHDLSEMRRGIKITNVAYGERADGNQRSVVKLTCRDEEHEWGNEASSSEASPRETILVALVPKQMEHAQLNVELAQAIIDCCSIVVSGDNPVYLTGIYTDGEESDGEAFANDEEMDLDDVDEVAEEVRSMQDMHNRWRLDEAYKTIAAAKLRLSSDKSKGKEKSSDDREPYEYVEPPRAAKPFWELDMEDMSEDDEDYDENESESGEEIAMSDESDPDEFIDDVQEVKEELENARAQKEDPPIDFELRDAKFIVENFEASVGV